MEVKRKVPINRRHAEYAEHNNTYVPYHRSSQIPKCPRVQVYFENKSSFSLVSSGTNSLPMTRWLNAQGRIADMHFCICFTTTVLHIYSYFKRRMTRSHKLHVKTGRQAWNLEVWVAIHMLNGVSQSNGYIHRVREKKRPEFFLQSKTLTNVDIVS